MTVVKSFLTISATAFLCGPEVFGFNSYLAGLRSFSSDPFDVPVLAARKGHRRPIKPLSPQATEDTSSVTSHHHAPATVSLPILELKKSKRTSSKGAASRGNNSTSTFNSAKVTSKKGATSRGNNSTTSSARAAPKKPASRAPAIRKELAVGRRTKDAVKVPELPRLIVNHHKLHELGNVATKSKVIKELRQGPSEIGLSNKLKLSDPGTSGTAAPKSTNEGNANKPPSNSGFKVEAKATMSKIDDDLATVDPVMEISSVVDSSIVRATPVQVPSRLEQNGEGDQTVTKMITPISSHANDSTEAQSIGSKSSSKTPVTASPSYSVFGKKHMTTKSSTGGYLSHLETGVTTSAIASVASPAVKSLSHTVMSSATVFPVGLANESPVSTVYIRTNSGFVTEPIATKVSSGAGSTSNLDSPMPVSSSKSTPSPSDDARLPVLQPTSPSDTRVKAHMDKEPLPVTNASTKKSPSYSGFGVKLKAPQLSTGGYANGLERLHTVNSDEIPTASMPTPSLDKAKLPPKHPTTSTFTPSSAEASSTSYLSGLAEPSHFPTKSPSASYSGFGKKQTAPKLSGYANNLGAAGDVSGIALVETSAVPTTPRVVERFVKLGASPVDGPKTSYTGFGVKPKSVVSSEVGAASSSKTPSAAEHSIHLSASPKTSYTGLGMTPKSVTSVVGTASSMTPLVVESDVNLGASPVDEPKKSYTGFGVKPKSVVLPEVGAAPSRNVPASQESGKPTSNEATEIQKPKSSYTGFGVKPRAPQINTDGYVGKLERGGHNVVESAEKPAIAPVVPAAASPKPKTSYTGFGVKPRAPVVDRTPAAFAKGILDSPSPTRLEADALLQEPKTSYTGFGSKPQAPQIHNGVTFGTSSVESLAVPLTKKSYSGFGVKPRVPSQPSLGHTYLDHLQTNRVRPVSAGLVGTAGYGTAEWIQRTTPAPPTSGGVPYSVVAFTSTSSGTDYLASLSGDAQLQAPLTRATKKPVSSYTGFGPATLVAWKQQPTRREGALPAGSPSSSAVGGGGANATLSGAFE